MKSCDICSKKHCLYHFTSNDSNVNVAFLDLSKAFDKINHNNLFHKLNHNNLFYKLVKRGIPTCVANILINWFSGTMTSVMYNGIMFAVNIYFNIYLLYI